MATTAAAITARSTTSFLSAVPPRSRSKKNATDAPVKPCAAIRYFSRDNGAARQYVLERGAWFVSSEHDAAIVDRTLDAVRTAAREVAAPHPA